MTKPTKWLYAQRRLRSAWASAQSDQSSLSAWRNIGPFAVIGAHCELWSDWASAQVDLSLRLAHVILFVLSSAGSYKNKHEKGLKLNNNKYVQQQLL